MGSAPCRMLRLRRVSALLLRLEICPIFPQGQALQALGLHSELVLLLFTMVDRHDAESPWAPFWRSLPQRLVTGRRVLPAKSTACLLLAAWPP